MLAVENANRPRICIIACMLFIAKQNKKNIVKTTCNTCNNQRFGSAGEDDVLRFWVNKNVAELYYVVIRGSLRLTVPCLFYSIELIW